MPRSRHHPAAVAEVVLHNEPPAARSVAQLLSRADQVAASRRGRSGAQECRPSTPHYPLAAGRGAASGHQPQLLPGWSARCWLGSAETGAGSELQANAPAVAVPTATRAPVGGRQLAVGGSAAWLRGGGLTRRARWKTLDGLIRAPGLLLTPVPLGAASRITLSRTCLLYTSPS